MGTGASFLGGKAAEA